MLEVNTPDSDKVTSGGSGGTFQPDQFGTFTGTVADLAAQNGVDLPGNGFDASTTLVSEHNEHRRCADTPRRYLHRRDGAARQLYGVDIGRRRRRP